jgi:hypothetical protein
MEWVGKAFHVGLEPQPLHEGTRLRSNVGRFFLRANSGLMWDDLREGPYLSGTRQ